MWGSMHAAQSDPLRFHLDLGRFGDVVRYRAGLWPVYFVHHPDAVRHVLQENARNYTKDTFAYGLIRRITGAGLLTADGETWLRQRRLMQPAFHQERIATLAAGMVTTTSARMADWQTTETMDIATEMQALTLEILGRTLFGIEMAGEAGQVRTALTTGMEQILAQLRSKWVWLWGLLDRVTPSSRTFWSSRRVLDDVMERIIADKRRHRGQEDDLLSTLLEARDEQTGRPMGRPAASG